MQASVWRGKGEMLSDERNGRWLTASQNRHPLRALNPHSISPGSISQGGIRDCRQGQFSFLLSKRKTKQNQIYALCLSFEKHSFPACPKHTSPSTESHTQLCTVDGCWRGGEGSCGTEELEQDIPSVLMTRPATPVMRKANVLQKVSRCFILGGMKADSLDVMFSSAFILC